MSTATKTDEDVPSTHDVEQATNPAAPLKVWTNHTDTVVAEDWDGVVETMKEYAGEAVAEDLEPEAWRAVDPWKEIQIHWCVERHGFPTPVNELRSVPEKERRLPEWTHHIYAPAFAWAQLVGDQSFLCSTEW